MASCQAITIFPDGSLESKIVKIDSRKDDSISPSFSERDKLEAIKDQVISIIDLLIFEMLSVDEITSNIIEKIYQKIISIENDDLNILAIKEILREIIRDRLAERESISGINENYPYAYSEKFICTDNFLYCNPIRKGTTGDDSDSDDDEPSEMIGINIQFKIIIPILLNDVELLIYPFGSRSASTMISGTGGGASLKTKETGVIILVTCEYIEVDGGRYGEFTIKGTICNKNGKYAIQLSKDGLKSGKPLLVSYLGSWYI